MFRAALVLSGLLLATPAVAQSQISCVENEQTMRKAAANAGESLQWVGVNVLRQLFWFYANYTKQTYTVWFALPDGKVCTGPGYIGHILKAGESV